MSNQNMIYVYALLNQSTVACQVYVLWLELNWEWFKEAISLSTEVIITGTCYGTHDWPRGPELQLR